MLSSWGWARMLRMQGTPGTCLHLGEPHPELYLPVPWPPGSGLPLPSLWPCSHFAAYSQEAVSAREQCPVVTHPDLLGLTGAQPGAVTGDSKAVAKPQQTVAQDVVPAPGTPGLSTGDMCVTSSGAGDGICDVVAAAASWGTHLCCPSLSGTRCPSRLWPSQHWRIDPEVGAIHSCPVCQGGLKSLRFMSHETIFMTPLFLELCYLEAPFCESVRRYSRQGWPRCQHRLSLPALPGTGGPFLPCARGEARGCPCPERCRAGRGVTRSWWLRSCCLWWCRQH